MKNTLTTLACALLCAALVIGGICHGAVRGWRAEQDKVLHPDRQEGTVYAALSERAMDAANLCVVAARHLPADDSRLTELRSLRATLENEQATTVLLAQADQRLTALALQLADELPKLDTVQQSPRDQVYISTLTRILGEASGSGSSYLTQVRAFNHRLRSSFTGRLAIALGVMPLAEEGGLP